MYRSTLFALLIFMSLAGPALAQEQMNSREVESKSYQLYMDHHWPELIAWGRQALDEGYDYFYLRLRMGIAFYNQGEFRTAANHFRKALAFNSRDALTQEYLYYALLYADQYDVARKATRSFDEAVSKKINKDSWSPVDFAYAEGGIKISSRSDLFNPAIYFQAGLRHTLGNSFSLFHAITVYDQTEKRGKISQLQYFIQPSIPLGNGWTITPSLHVVGLNFQQNTGILKSTDLVGSMSVTKSFSKMDLSVGGTVSDVLSTLQYIQQTTLTVYPFGNSNFSLGAIAYIHSENSFVTSTLAANPFISWSPAGWLRLSGGYFANKNENLVEMNGYLVNNSPDLTLSRTSFMATFSLSRHWDFYSDYQYENKQQSGTIAYTYNVFLFGLKFKPL